MSDISLLGREIQHLCFASGSLGSVQEKSKVTENGLVKAWSKTVSRTTELWNLCCFRWKLSGPSETPEIQGLLVNLGGLGWWTQGIQILDPNHEQPTQSTNHNHQLIFVFLTNNWSAKTLKTLKILLMEEILHQLRLVVYPIIFQAFSTIPGGCLGFCSSTVSFYTHLSVCVFLVSNSSRPLLHRTWATKLCSWSFQGNLRKFLGNLGVGEILFHLAGYMDPMIYPLACQS